MLTHKFNVVSSYADRRDFLHSVLAPLWRMHPSAALYTSAMELTERYALGFYDSLIVASALEAGCKRLLTEDLQHGQRIKGLRIENPFVA